MAMTKTQIWSLAIGSAVLGAAATAAVYELSVKERSVAMAGHCDGAECQIAVKVIDCANGVIDVSPDPAHINAAKHIKWTIVSSGYVFTPTGIQISGLRVHPRPRSHRLGRQVAGQGRAPKFSAPRSTSSK